MSSSSVNSGSVAAAAAAALSGVVNDVVNDGKAEAALSLFRDHQNGAGIAYTVPGGVQCRSCKADGQVVQLNEGWRHGVNCKSQTQSHT